MLLYRLVLIRLVPYMWFRSSQPFSPLSWRMWQLASDMAREMRLRHYCVLSTGFLFLLKYC